MPFPGSLLSIFAFLPLRKGIYIFEIFRKVTLQISRPSHWPLACFHGGWHVVMAEWEAWQPSPSGYDSLFYNWTGMWFLFNNGHHCCERWDLWLSIEKWEMQHVCFPEWQMEVSDTFIVTCQSFYSQEQNLQPYLDQVGQCSMSELFCTWMTSSESLKCLGDGQ